MSTQLNMFRGQERMKKITVPHCPMFEEPNTPEYRKLVSQGWHYSGHIDGVTLHVEKR